MKDPQNFPTRTAAGNLLAVPEPADEEIFDVLLSAPGVRIERIVSNGQASPPGFWYDQDWAEWVLVVTGSAEILIEGEPAPRGLVAGDHLFLPAGCRHRVESTAHGTPTVWLAVHLQPPRHPSSGAPPAAGSGAASRSS